MKKEEIRRILRLVKNIKEPYVASMNNQERYAHFKGFELAKELTLKKIKEEKI